MTKMHALGIALLLLTPAKPDIEQSAPPSVAQVATACHVLHENAKRALANNTSTLLVYRYYQVFTDIKQTAGQVPDDCNMFFLDFYKNNRITIEGIQDRLAIRRVGSGFTHKEVEWLKALRDLDEDSRDQQLLLIKLRTGQIKEMDLKPIERFTLERAKEQLQIKDQ